MADLEVIDKKKKQFVNASLQRMVDWKVFELCALLIDTNITPELCEEGRIWLQPRHLEEVIAERVNNDLCGHLLCNNQIKKGPRNGGTRYRLEYNTKRVYEVNEEALKFCCVECYEASLVYLHSLDTTIPYSRPVAKELLKQEAKQQATAAGPTVGVSYASKGIDDIISLLSRGEEAVQNAPQSSPVGKKQQTTVVGSDEEDDGDRQQHQMLSPPPLYSNEVLSEYGEVQHVEFAAGQPLIRPPQDIDVGKSKATKSMITGTKVRFQDEMDENTVKTTDTPDAVYMPDNTFIKREVPNREASTASKAGSQVGSPSTGSNNNSPHKKDDKSGKTDVLSLLKEMESLQMKYSAPKGAPVQFAPKRSAATNYNTLGTNATVVTTNVMPAETSPAPSPEKVNNNRDRPPSPDQTSTDYDQTAAQANQLDEDSKLLAIMNDPTKASQNKKNSRRVRKVVDWGAPTSDSATPANNSGPQTEKTTDPPIDVDKNTISLKPKNATATDSSSRLTTDLQPNNTKEQPSGGADIPKGILKNTEPQRKANYKPIPKVATPVIAMTINEKPNAAPLSAAALLSKREPNAIEGYVPQGSEHDF
jgi:hypothetical protein